MKYRQLCIAMSVSRPHRTDEHCTSLSEPCMYFHVWRLHIETTVIKCQCTRALRPCDPRGPHGSCITFTDSEGGTALRGEAAKDGARELGQRWQHTRPPVTFAASGWVMRAKDRGGAGIPGREGPCRCYWRSNLSPVDLFLNQEVHSDAAQPAAGELLKVFKGPVTSRASRCVRVAGL